MRQRLIFTIFVRANTHIMTKVTYYGHACFLVETGGSRLLFDPFITKIHNIKSGNQDISQWFEKGTFQW